MNGPIHYRALVNSCGTRGMYFLHHSKTMIRFENRRDNISSMLNGRLNLLQTALWKDPLEAARTERDIKWLYDFLLQDEGVYDRLNAAQTHMRLNSYGSCWHILSSESDLAKLRKEYISEKDDSEFQFIVLTNTDRLKQLFSDNIGYFEDGTSSSQQRQFFLDIFPVRYLDEADSGSDEIKKEFSSSFYSALEFKRKTFAWENEARFLLHDASAQDLKITSSSFNGDKLLKLNIDPKVFIEAIYALNDKSFKFLEEQTSQLTQVPIFNCKNIEEFKEKIGFKQF